MKRTLLLYLEQRFYGSLIVNLSLRGNWAFVLKFILN